MDPVSLATTTTTLLIPYLTKIGGKVLEDLGKSTWDLIMESFKDKPASANTAEEFAAKTDDPDNRAAFEAQLRKAFKENPDFAREIEGLLKRAEEAGITNSSGALAMGNDNTAFNFEGDMSGNLIVGNNNKITQSGERPGAERASRKSRKNK